MIAVLALTTSAAFATAAQASPLPLLLRHFQPFPTPQAIHLRVVRLPAFVAKKATDLTIAKPRTFLRQLQHPLYQRHLVATRLPLIFGTWGENFPGNVDFDRGSVFTIEKLALWNDSQVSFEDRRSIKLCDVFTDSNSAFSSATHVGSFVDAQGGIWERRR